MNKINTILFFLLFQFISNAQVKEVWLPQVDTISLPVIAQLDMKVNKENSGIVKSSIYNDTYWLINDSGDTPRIIPIDNKGNTIFDKKYSKSKGQLIADAVNLDWEDIFKDDRGNLIVADFGNNCNCRRDLVFYYIRESDPKQHKNRVLKKVFFQYPDQKQFTKKGNDYNFDAEAAFYAFNKIYVLSKNRSNSHTKLYRLDREKPFEVNTLTLLDEFNIRGQVTAADVSSDGKTLAVLTFTGVWVFKSKYKDNYFDGDIYFLPIRHEGMEGICFDDEQTLIITSEPKGTLHKLKISELTKVN